MIEFFQTFGVKRFVFADCENGNVNKAQAFIDFLKSKEYLNIETQIVCFLGAKQNDWYNKAIKHIKELDEKHFNIMPVRITTEGKNALDMVLCAYIGFSIVRNPNAEFVIVSGDNDYRSVEEHFSALGISIKCEIIEKGSDEQTQQIEEILNRIKKQKGKPKTVGKFNNFLRNAFQKIINDENKDEISKEVIAKLKEGKIISEEKGKIMWKLV